MTTKLKFKMISHAGELIDPAGQRQGRILTASLNMRSNYLHFLCSIDISQQQHRNIIILKDVRALRALLGPGGIGLYKADGKLCCSRCKLSPPKVTVWLPWLQESTRTSHNYTFASVSGLPDCQQCV
jgi:hypothetical protein